MSIKYYLIIVMLITSCITKVFCQVCELDTAQVKPKRFYPDFPMNKPYEGYKYRFDTLPDGSWKQYRESQSNVYKLWRISKGQLHGSMVYFNEWGERIITECYEAGKLLSAVTYHSNGIFCDLWIFNSAQELASRRNWYPNGVIRIEANINIQKRWWDDGSLWVRKRYENSSLVQVELYHKGGQIYYHGFWKDGNPIKSRQFIYEKNSAKSIQYNSLKEELRRIIESNDLVK